MATGKRRASDDVMRALDEFTVAVQVSQRKAGQAIRRAGSLRHKRTSGNSWTAITKAERRPLLVEMATDNLRRLQRAGASLRRAQARALRDEGLSMNEIAGLFGVTRQRVSALLRETEQDGRSR